MKFDSQTSTAQATGGPRWHGYFGYMNAFERAARPPLMREKEEHMKHLVRVLLIAFGYLAIGIATGHAEDYPSRPIHLIVGYVPGATTDFTARVLAEALTARLGQTVIVENKPGAGSMLAAHYVANSNPDGYTLLLGNADGITIPPAVRPQMQYRVPEDFSYIARAVQNPLTLAIGAKLPIKSIAELVTYAKANPGKVSYGTSGAGGSGHLAILRLQEQAGIELLHIPYKGTAGAVTDVLGGTIDMAISAPVGISAYRDSDKIRVIATTSPKRDSLLPDVPTLAEAGYPNATMQVWFGILGPAGLPDSVISRLTKAVSDAMNDPQVRKRFINVDLEPVPLYGKDFRQFVIDDLQAYKAIAKKANVVITD